MSLFMKNGKVKSTLLLNSFTMSFIFLVIYMLSYGLLLSPIDNLLLGKIEPGWISFLETLISGITGSLICCISFYLFKEKKVVLYAYLLLTIYCVGILVGISISLESGERYNFLYIALLYILVPLISGSSLSICLYLGYIKKQKTELTSKKKE